jgi:hypothetical protein
VPIVSGVATVNPNTKNNSFKIIVNAAVTVNISALLQGSSPTLTILFQQDSTGHAVTFGTAFASASAPIIPTTASSSTSVSFRFDGASGSWYGAQSAGTTWIGKVELCGTTVACAKTIQSAPIIVYGTAPLTTGSPSTATLTALPFTSTTSYVCTANDTAAVQALQVANASAPSTVITGPNTSTDVVNFTCVGN